jgi:thiol-disulfide isomerase/thioredoxin
MLNRFSRIAFLAVAGLMITGSQVFADDLAETKKVAQKLIGRQLITKYRAAYRSFTKDVVRTKSKSSAERLQVFKKSTAEINGLFKAHVKTAAMGYVLPEMGTAKGIDLSPTLTAVIQGNTNTDIRATAIYTLAAHLHNTHRDEKRAIALLKFVQQNFTKVTYQETTLGEAAKTKLYEMQHLSLGKLAPDVVGEDADGAKFRVSDYRGKVIVLRFWGDWCPFCRSMFPQERELVKTYRDKPFVILGVNSDPRARLKKAQKEKNLVWRSFWDGGTSNGPIAQVYRVTEWPTIYVIDHKGKIRYKGEGIRGSRVKWLEPAVKKLLAEAKRDSQVSVK